METQNCLYSNSKEIPEGLYIELMNKLKIDFESTKKEKSVLVINRSLAKNVLSSKKELIESIIKCSVDWEDREDVLIKINRMSYSVLKEYCISRRVPIMKVNPRWVEQERLVQNHGAIDFFRANSPYIINIHN